MTIKRWILVLLLSLLCLSVLSCSSLSRTRSMPMAQLVAEAEAGDAWAQCNLGTCFAYGRGVTNDTAEAAKWYRKAADQGNATAQFNLGVCHEKGEGVDRDPVQACKLFRLASKNGVGDAKNRLSALESTMTREQIAEAKKLASEFKPLK